MFGDEAERPIETELEALESIYIDELDVIRKENGDIDEIKLLLHPATGDDVTQQFVCMTVVFQVSSEYPDEIPSILIRNPRGLGEEELSSLVDDMKSKAEESKGEVMLYTLIEMAKDILTEGNVPHCPCVVCLEHFNECSSFWRTECYHYFHNSCLQRYLNHAMAALEEARKEAEERKHFSADSKADVIVCPICRTPLDEKSLNVSCPVEEVEDDEQFELSQTLREQQHKMAEIYERQKANGGIIDVEMEKNRFLVNPDDRITLVYAGAAEVAPADVEDADLKASSKTMKETRTSQTQESKSRSPKRGAGPRHPKFDHTKNSENHRLPRQNFSHPRRDAKLLAERDDNSCYSSNGTSPSKGKAMQYGSGEAERLANISGSDRPMSNLSDGHMDRFEQGRNVRVRSGRGRGRGATKKRWENEERNTKEGEGQGKAASHSKSKFKGEASYKNQHRRRGEEQKIDKSLDRFCDSEDEPRPPPLLSGPSEWNSGGENKLLRMKNTFTGRKEGARNGPQDSDDRCTSERRGPRNGPRDSYCGFTSERREARRNGPQDLDDRFTSERREGRRNGPWDSIDRFASEGRGAHGTRGRYERGSHNPTKFSSHQDLEHHGHIGNYCDDRVFEKTDVRQRRGFFPEDANREYDGATALDNDDSHTYRSDRRKSTLDNRSNLGGRSWSQTQGKKDTYNEHRSQHSHHNHQDHRRQDHPRDRRQEEYSASRRYEPESHYSNPRRGGGRNGQRNRQGAQHGNNEEEDEKEDLEKDEKNFEINKKWRQLNFGYTTSRQSYHQHERDEICDSRNDLSYDEFESQDEIRTNPNYELNEAAELSSIYCTKAGDNEESWENEIDPYAFERRHVRRNQMSDYKKFKESDRKMYDERLQKRVDAQNEMWQEEERIEREEARKRNVAEAVHKPENVEKPKSILEQFKENQKKKKAYSERASGKENEKNGVAKNKDHQNHQPRRESHTTSSSSSDIAQPGAQRSKEQPPNTNLDVDNIVWVGSNSQKGVSASLGHIHNGANLQENGNRDDGDDCFEDAWIRKKELEKKMKAERSRLSNKDKIVPLKSKPAIFEESQNAFGQSQKKKHALQQENKEEEKTLSEPSHSQPLNKLNCSKDNLNENKTHRRKDSINEKEENEKEVNSTFIKPKPLCLHKKKDSQPKMTRKLNCDEAGFLREKNFEVNGELLYEHTQVFEKPDNESYSNRELYNMISDIKSSLHEEKDEFDLNTVFSYE